MVEHRSSSQYSSYVDCSELYRLKYIERVEQPPAAWLAQGLAFHEAIHEWEDSGRHPNVDPVAAYANLYMAKIFELKAKYPDPKSWLKAPSKKTEDDIKERLERGQQQIRDYVSYTESYPFAIKDIDDFTLALEVPFQIELGGITVKGQIDEIWEWPDGVEVIDLKTGNREASGFQLGLYKVAVEKIFGWKVVKASYYYAKDSVLKTIDGRDLERYTESYVTELLQALDAGIANKVFLPNPGSKCTMCSVRKFCREFS